MTSARKLLKYYYFGLKLNPQNQAAWKSMMPATELDVVAQNPIYIANRDSYLRSGPRLWVYLLLHKNGHLTSKQIFNLYNIDEQATEQRFFES